MVIACRALQQMMAGIFSKKIFIGGHAIKVWKEDLKNNTVQPATDSILSGCEIDMLLQAAHYFSSPSRSSFPLKCLRMGSIILLI